MKKEYLIYKLSEEMKEATRIDTELFSKFDVKRGLRNEDGTGVLVGLTRIGNVVGYERVPGGGLKPIPGKLFYRGYDVEDISHAIIKEKRFGFDMLRHATFGRSLHIRHPQEKLSIAENFLYMLKKDYTELDARTLDLLLILQAEHGGGNNSTFTVRVTSSTGTDTYSAIAAGIGSLKGPLHGGANIQVADMFQHLKENIKDWTSVDEIDTYYTRMLNKEVYNKTGLIYGIGHAVYTISDPRALLLKELARDLAREKGRESEFAFLELLEERAIATFGQVKNNGKTVSSNIDFYSGFVYEMIGLPQEIFTPLFAMARIVGWCAHRNEELTFDGKRIIRPAYKNVLDDLAYIPIKKR